MPQASSQGWMLHCRMVHVPTRCSSQLLLMTFSAQAHTRWHIDHMQHTCRQFAPGRTAMWVCSAVTENDRVARCIESLHPCITCCGSTAAETAVLAAAEVDVSPPVFAATSAKKGEARCHGCSRRRQSRRATAT